MICLVHSVGIRVQTWIIQLNVTAKTKASLQERWEASERYPASMQRASKLKRLHMRLWLHMAELHLRISIQILRQNLLTMRGMQGLLLRSRLVRHKVRSSMNAVSVMWRRMKHFLLAVTDLQMDIVLSVRKSVRRMNVSTTLLKKHV